MKISYTHLRKEPSKLPVGVLCENLIVGFESIHEDFKVEAKMVHEKYNLNNGIKYIINEKGIYENENHTPHLTILNGGIREIILYETYSAYLWIVCYSLFINFNEIIHIPAITGNYDNVNMTKLQKSINLLGYGLSLIRDYTVWDINGQPNPEIYEKEEEFEIGCANHSYVNAMVFILLHEFYHAKLEHEPTHINSLGKSNEYTADSNAFDAVIKGMNNENKKLNTGIGGISALCSLLFLSKNTCSLTHPGSDERIKIFMEKLNIEDDNDELWGIPCIAFYLWDKYYGFDFDWGDRNRTYKELFYNLYHQ